jgi:hypothetical protein
MATFSTFDAAKGGGGGIGAAVRFVSLNSESKRHFGKV